MFGSKFITQRMKTELFSECITLHLRVLNVICCFSLRSLVTMSSYSVSSHGSSLLLTVIQYHQYIRAEYGDMKYCYLQINPLFKVISY